MEVSTELIAKLPLFSSLSPEELKLIISLIKKATYDEGQIIFKEGDEGGTFYIVLEGAICISTLAGDDLEKPLVTLREGNAFGEVSLIDHNPREARATATQKSALLEMNSADFEKMIDDHPLLGMKILKFLTRTVVDRIRNTTDQYRRNIQWSLNVSGALKMNWGHLVTDEIELCLELNNGKSISGTFIKVEESPSSYEFFMRGSDDKIFIVPYHAVVSISFKRDDSRSSKKGQRLQQNNHDA